MNERSYISIPPRAFIVWTGTAVPHEQCVKQYCNTDNGFPSALQPPCNEAVHCKLSELTDATHD